MSISVYPCFIKLEHGAYVLFSIYQSRKTCQVLAVFYLGMTSRVQRGPSLHLRLNNLILQRHQIFLRCVFKHTLLDHSTGKEAKRPSHGTHLHTSPPDLLTCFLLRGAHNFSQQHNPILSCVSAVYGKIGRPSIFPKRNFIWEKFTTNAIVKISAEYA